MRLRLPAIVLVGFALSPAAVLADALTDLRAALARLPATAPVHGEAIDPERSTPVRSGLRRVRPIHVAELLDAAASMNVVLQNAQLVQTKGRVIVLKLAPKLADQFRERSDQSSQTTEVIRLE